MVRKLKHHEQKLLKKVDFISWHTDKREVKLSKMITEYHVVKRDDISKYTMLADMIIKLKRKINQVGEADFKEEMASELDVKLHSLGLVRKNLRIKHFNEKNFCQRRLPVMMVNKGMVTKVNEATTFVQQGHVRVGPEIIKDPAYLVTRHMEDFITWVDTCTIKRHVMEYNEMRDDYEMM